MLTKSFNTMERINSRANTSVIREAIIREQFKRMFPNIETIEIIFCAHEMSKLISNFNLNPQHDGGKC